MPKTKFQSFIFTLIMVFCTVYCMTLYIISIQNGGLENNLFLIALQEMAVEYIICIYILYDNKSNKSINLSYFLTPKKTNLFSLRFLCNALPLL